MISVLTLTYQRHHLLEECIQSFLLQNNKDSELVIINDSANCHYVIEHPQITIYNLKERFSSISKKLEWGFKKCKHNFIYRLDDDDLLAPNALNNAEKFIKENPNYDIYRSKTQYFFLDNKFEKIGGNVNNGNIYTKEYIDRIVFPNKSFGEDYDITYGFGGKIYQDEGKPTMIYRWGMNTYHVSGLGEVSTEFMYEKIDGMTKKNTGSFILEPKFNGDYYKNIGYI